VIPRRQLLRLSCAALLSLALVGCDRSTATRNDSRDYSEVTANLDVFRSASCGCCGKWVEHMETAGFTVNETITEELTAIKQQNGVSPELASCHTTIADGYVIEGHIPASDVQRLLAEKPDVTGLAVPGMPIGSPGMEIGDEVEPYAVLSFKDGEVSVFSEHP